MAETLDFPTDVPNGTNYTASNGIVYQFNGKSVFSPGYWISVGALDENNPAVIMEPNAPLAPYNGSLWFDTQNDVLKVYVNGQWKNA